MDVNEVSTMTDAEAETLLAEHKKRLLDEEKVLQEKIDGEFRRHPVRHPKFMTIEVVDEPPAGLGDDRVGWFFPPEDLWDQITECPFTYDEFMDKAKVATLFDLGDGFVGGEEFGRVDEREKYSPSLVRYGSGNGNMEWQLCFPNHSWLIGIDDNGPYAKTSGYAYLIPDVSPVYRHRSLVESDNDQHHPVYAGMTFDKDGACAWYLIAGTVLSPSSVHLQLRKELLKKHPDVQDVQIICGDVETNSVVEMNFAVRRAIQGIYRYHGKSLHRDDGPAVIYSDGTLEWWVNGVEIDND